jgi:hypothetical protein
MRYSNQDGDGFGLLGCQVEAAALCGEMQAPRERGRYASRAGQLSGFRKKLSSTGL